jgi:zinc protease
MMKNKTIKSILLVAGICTNILSGTNAYCLIDTPKTKSSLIPITKDFKLKNGLRVIFSEDHTVPVAAMVIVYDVGARNEEKGHSGFAHLFEHMMFEGSENVGKTEYFKHIESAGGSLNASTHPDFTNYFEKLPSNQIELALWLESDRMRSLKITEENFQNQLETVKEEKRLRIDNQPYGPASIKLDELIFDNWTNAHPVIGDFADLEASTAKDAKKFFNKYYAPNNAVLAMVGDFNSNDMKKLIEKYFSSIPSVPAAAKPNISEPKQTKEKYLKLADQHAKAPAFWVAWKAPARREPDYYALGIIEKLLSAGDSSRLYQRMVKGDKNALKVDAGYDERRGPSAFEIFAIVKPDSTPEKVRASLFDEIEKLKTKPVLQEELDKAKNQISRDLFASDSSESLQRSIGRAELLAEYASFFGNAALLDKDIENYMAVKPEDIQRVARTIFTKEGTTIVDVYPEAKKEQTKESTQKTE